MMGIFAQAAAKPAAWAPAVQLPAGQACPLPGTFYYSWAIANWWMSRRRKTQLDFVYWDGSSALGFLKSCRVGQLTAAARWARARGTAGEGSVLSCKRLWLMERFFSTPSSF